MIAPLKSSVVFLADLTRALPIPHTLDLVELAAYTGSDDGGVRLLKDVDAPLEDRHVLIVEDVIDTGLTLQLPLQDACAPQSGKPRGGVAPRPPVQAACRRHPPSLRRLHGSGRALRRLRPRPGRALARISGPAQRDPGRALRRPRLPPRGTAAGRRRRRSRAPRNAGAGPRSSRSSRPGRASRPARPAARRRREWQTRARMRSRDRFRDRRRRGCRTRRASPRG